MINCVWPCHLIRSSSPCITPSEHFWFVLAKTHQIKDGIAFVKVWRANKVIYDPHCGNGVFSILPNPSWDYSISFTYSMHLGNNVKIHLCSLFAKLVAKSSNLATTSCGYWTHHYHWPYQNGSTWNISNNINITWHNNNIKTSTKNIISKYVNIINKIS